MNSLWETMTFEYLFFDSKDLSFAYLRSDRTEMANVLIS